MQGTASAPVSRHGSEEDLLAVPGMQSGTAQPNYSGLIVNDFAGARDPTAGVPAVATPEQHDIIHTSSAPQVLFKSDGPDQRPSLSKLNTNAPQSENGNGRPTTAPSIGTPALTVDGEHSAGTGNDLRPTTRRRHSGHSHRYQYEPYSAGSYSGYSFYGRPPDHQSAHHRTPLYSLARPLPTYEQRQAQKSYRDQIRTNAAVETVAEGGKHSHHHRHHHGHSSGRQTPHNQEGIAHIGPGAVHHGGVASGPAITPFMRPVRSVGSFTNTQNDREQLMVMLRQILTETQQSGQKVSKLAAGADDDIMEDRTGDKENGPGGDKQNEKIGDSHLRTSRAERRDSVTSSTDSSSSSTSDDAESFPNPIAQLRHVLREPLAEFLGTFLLIMFGTGVSLQYFLTLNPAITSTPFGTYTNVSLGWGVGVAMGVWTAGGISGGHINPAVTISLAIFRGFPWRKVPGYILAQIMGSMTAAGINYALYRGAISIYEGGASIRTVTGPTATASLFSTYPQSYVTDATAFFQEFVNSAILLIVVLAISDSNNASPPDGLNPLVLFLLILGLGACLGMQTAYCVNPARDLGPRLVTWFAGYGREVWDFRSQYWLWVPICATISGALFGSFVYDFLIYTGSESPLNRKWTWPWSKKPRSGFAPASKNKLPAGQIEP